LLAFIFKPHFFLRGAHPTRLGRVLGPSPEHLEQLQANVSDADPDWVFNLGTRPYWPLFHLPIFAPMFRLALLQVSQIPPTKSLNRNTVVARKFFHRVDCSIPKGCLKVLLVSQLLRHRIDPFSFPQKFYIHSQARAEEERLGRFTSL
jgi:hypothetical protein